MDLGMDEEDTREVGDYMLLEVIGEGSFSEVPARPPGVLDSPQSATWSRRGPSPPNPAIEPRVAILS